jgi:hypothetical protein
MAILFFLPWVSIDYEVHVSNMRFTPYVRGEDPGEIHGVPQAFIDAVLGSYGNQTFFPNRETTAHVSQATIITWADDAPGLEVPEEMIGLRLEQARYIGFAAIAKRRLCANFGYCNSDGYQVIAQRFQSDTPGATALTTRRRDGHGTHYVGEAPLPRFIRPHHVDGHLNFDVDIRLLQALLELNDGNLKGRVDESIDSYLLANTDSRTMRERSEMVLMRVAFETIFEANHETSDLRMRLHQHFLHELPSPPVWSQGSLSEEVWRRRWNRPENRPLDSWIQDFCASRNAAAHGPRGSRDPAVWQPHNHLLFSSWLFPLVVKKLLADEGHYALSDEDLAARRGLEMFFGYDLLAYCDDDERDLWWNRVDRDILMPVIASRIFTHMEDG